MDDTAWVERARPGLGLAGFAVLSAAMPVAVLSYRALPLTAGVGMLLIAVGAGAREAAVPRLDRPLVIVLALLLAWAAASFAWTLDVRSALRVFSFEVLLFVVLACVAWWASPRLEAGRAAAILAGLLALGAVLVIVETRLGMPLRKLIGSREWASKINQAAVILSLWIWPAMALLKGSRGRVAMAGLFALALVAVMMSESESAKLAMILGAVAALLWSLPWKGRGVVLALALAAAVALQPVMANVVAQLLTKGEMHALKGAHMAERLVIWQAFTEAASMKPLLGWGFNASGWIGRDERLNLFAEALRPGIVDSHPHDMLLQVWVELGIIGALLMAAFLARVAWLAAGLKPWLSPYVVGALVTGIIVAMVGYGAWQAWWVAGLAGLVTLVRVAEGCDAATLLRR
jgi:O-antigen ligase